MPTDALRLHPHTTPGGRVDVGSPWRRLHWTLPLALAICALVFVFFSISTERAAPRPSQPAPVDAQIVELPAAPATRAAPEQPPPPPKPAAPPEALPPVAAQTQAAARPAPAAPAPPAAPVAVQSHAARAFSQPMPVIPDELRDEAMHEQAIARFHIAADGSATVELVKPTQNPRLNRLLLETLRRWKFDPATQDGKAAPSVEDIVIHIQVD